MSLGPFLKRAFIWVGPTIVFCVSAELAARWFYATGSKVIQEDPVLNHVWIPNQSRTERSFEDRGVPAYTRRSNAQGFMMERDVSELKEPGTYRVVYLGDSFTEGTAQEGDSVPALVERSLSVPGYQRVEVINTGTASYAPTLYYLLLKTKVLALHPDLVVVNVDMTDVFDDSLYRATLKRDEQGEPLACPPGHPLLGSHLRTERGLERVSRAQRGVLWLSAHSDAVKILVQAFARNKDYRSRENDRNPPQAFAWCASNRSEEVQESARWSMSMLKKVIQLAKRHGVTIVITGVPHLQQLDGRWSLQPMEDIAAVCAEEGVPFLNPVEAFKKKLGDSPPQDIYIPKDMHFNSKGYRMWAEIQLEFLSVVLK